MAASIIQLTPASQAFVDARATTLGPWVIGACFDCVLMGIVFCQIKHYFHNRQRDSKRLQTYETTLVGIVTILSVLKTMQVIAIVWEQNVMTFADPDKARLLANSAWWQVSAPLMTGVTGFVVQTFFAYRFLKLTGNWWYFGLIVTAMLLGIIGGCFSTYHIVRNDVEEKVKWLLIHLVSVCVSDILITIGTVFALYRRNSGLSSTVSLINRLLRLVFEAAVPPAFIATVDLILTQTLHAKLLWHLVLNHSLAKLYVISLLYTLNSISDYRTEQSTNGKLSFSYGNSRASRMLRGGDVELGSRFTDGGYGQVQISTQISTHISPPMHSPVTPVTPLELTNLSSHKGLRTKSTDRLSFDDPDSTIASAI